MTAHQLPCSFPRSDAARDDRGAIHCFAPSLPRGFTLIEFLTTVAILVILMGMMVSLARYVRERAAQQRTQGLLADLDRMMSRYLDAAGQLPPVPALIPEGHAANEALLPAAARRNNEAFVKALRAQNLLSARPVKARAPATLPVEPPLVEQLPISLYNEVTLRDQWGSPIVFMAEMHPEIGMAPVDSRGRQRPFFFSAGPDGKYLTRADNLYSYEQAGGRQ